LFAAPLLCVIFLLVSTRLVAAQYYGGPGGQISGYVFGTNGAGYDWAQISANNGTETFRVFSGMSGFYLMRVPPGIWNVSVYVPDLPLYANSVANVTITLDSSVTVNFQLEPQSNVAVPEFQANITGLVMVFVLAAALIAVKKTTKRAGSRRD